MQAHIKRDMSKKEKKRKIGIAKKGWIYITSIIAVIFWALVAAVLFVDFVKGHYISALKNIVAIVLFIAIFAVFSILSKDDHLKE